MSRLLDKIAGIFNGNAESATGSVAAENGFVLKNSTKVSELKQAFNERFGSLLRVYEGRSQVDDAATLAEVGLTNEGTFECRGNLQVGTFITRMAEEHGLKVKVYTCDDWVAVLDGLTLTASGLVKKNATKADMETMLAGPSEGAAASGKTPVSEVKAGSFSIIKNSDGSYSVSIDGSICSNSKGAMRQIAEALGFEYDKAWTTQQFGAKLSRFIQENTGAAESAPAQKEEPAQEPNLAVDELKAEAERLKAEAEAAKAEAEKAKRAAEKAKVAPAPASVKANKKDGELPGVFTLKDGRKICFSKGNLQFHCKNYEFKLAEEQYETLGKEANEKCAPDYDGWIDIFGWGTSGYMGCQPTERGTTLDQYGPKTGDLTGDNANFDWGVYNPITNGGNKEGLWRTPSKEELLYLLKKRPGADRLRLKSCKVCGKEGTMLLPDNFWNNRLRFPIDITSSSNSFNDEQWKILESLGVVFLPKCLYKYYVKSWMFASWQSIWTSNYQTRMDMTSGDAFVSREARIYPVRLIKDLK